MGLRERSVIACALLLVGGPSQATPPPQKLPVPAVELRGSDLLLSAHGVAVPLPGEGWQWFRYGGLPTYFAERSTSEHPAYVLLETQKRSSGDRRSWYVKSQRRFFQSSGFKIAVVEEGATESPFPGTYRIALRATSRSGGTLYQYTYLLPMDLHLEVTSEEWPEPGWVSRWVRSCRRVTGDR